MGSCSTAINAVVSVRICEHIELDASLDEGVDHFVLVLAVDVVVSGSCYYEIIAFKVTCHGERAVVVVAIAVLFGLSHVAFGVDSVIKSPVYNGRNGYAHFEDVAFAETARAHEAAEAPSPDADARGVDVGQFGNLFGGGNLVVAFVFAKLEISAFAEFFATCGSATRVDTYDNVAA